MLERLRTERMRHWAIVVMWTMVIAAGVATAVVLLGGCGARTAEAQTPAGPDLTAELISSTAALLEAQNAALERSLRAREDAVTAREAAHEDLVEALTKRTRELESTRDSLESARQCMGVWSDLMYAMGASSFTGSQYLSSSYPEGVALAVRWGLRQYLIRMLDPENDQNSPRQNFFNRMADQIRQGNC